jgi:hypothetical protein
MNHEDSDNIYKVVEKLCPDMLFIVERNQNANVVVYRANRNADGSLNAQQPVIVEWIMFEDSSDGRVREPLTTMERKLAFGFNLKPLGGGHFTMIVHAIPSKPLRLFLDPNGFLRAGVQMDSGAAILQRIFIHVKNSTVAKIPSVLKAVAYGVKVDGSLVQQTICE